MTEQPNPTPTPKKSVHIKLDASLHKKLKASAAICGMTLKDYIIAKLKQ